MSNEKNYYIKNIKKYLSKNLFFGLLSQLKLMKNIMEYKKKSFGISV
jgi:hypothetical protein